jgi:hypothetical protein
MNSKWPDLLNMRFGVKLTDSEAKEWYLELRRTVRGYELNREIERDPFVSDQLKLINHEICETLRYIASMDRPPRADNERSIARYTVSDLQLWIAKYREHLRVNTTQDKSRRVTATKKICLAFYKKGDLANAAFSAYNPIHSKQGEIYLFQECIGNISLDHDEIREVEDYCYKQLGFNPSKERRKWAQENYERIMGIPWDQRGKKNYDISRR